MKRVAIIQARINSSRLPGKVLMEIGGRSMLARVIQRVRRANLVDEVLVATTPQHADDPIVSEARTLHAGVYRGDEGDVLTRYYEAATSAQAELVIRITADCPLVDPALIDEVIRRALDQYPDVDYATNVLHRTYPRGLDVEVAPFRTLEQVWREARQPYQRIHVFPYVREHPERFRLVNVAQARDDSRMRWTVDTADDLEFIRAVYQRMGNDETVSWHEVISLLRREPSLLGLNRHVRQKALQEG